MVFYKNIHIYNKFIIKVMRSKLGLLCYNYINKNINSKVINPDKSNSVRHTV